MARRHANNAKFLREQVISHLQQLGCIIMSGRGVVVKRTALCAAAAQTHQAVCKRPHNASFESLRDWNETMLVNKDLTNEIKIYLLSIGNEISGEKLRDFINSDDIMSRHGIDRKISMQTAQGYLKALGYRYGAPKKGQYVDGHEREDVIFYQEQVFLPQWRNIEHLMFSWDEDNLPEFGPRLWGH
jgi:hypothetical protein